MKKGSIAAVALLSALSFGSRAVVFYSTADPQHNTTPPTGVLAGSGWDLQGDAFPGTPIAPNFFITATHLGGQVGDVFTFRGVAYPMVNSFPHPDADITIWQVNGTFPQYAPLYSSCDEVSKSLVVFGRGAERGEEVRLNGVLKGWAWGKTDGTHRWGENVVAGISDQDGHPATSSTKFQLLRADFDVNGGSNEAQLSGGDSGGGVFINDGGVWKLAGVNHAANKDYSYTQTGPSFNATLFDEGGFWEGELAKREYHPDDPFTPQPGSFYATRISTYLGWIQSVTALPLPAAAITLEESPSLLGSYGAVAGANLNPATSTIAIPRPSGTRFYRIVGDRPYTITGMKQSGDQVLISYN